MVMISFPSSSLIFSVLFWRAVKTQITNATCRFQYEWMDNSRDQNPCLVAAYVQGACRLDGQWTVQALPNSTVTYSGPDVDQVSLCTCSSVAWALCSACAHCQGGDMPHWTDWIENCPNSEVSNGQFPVQIPDGTSVPAWAYQQANEELFNVTIAQAEATTATSSAVSATSSGIPVRSSSNSATGSSTGSDISANTSPAQLPTSKQAQKTHIEPIVGGAVGGGVGAVIILGIILWFCRRSMAITRRGTFDTIERPDRMDPATRVLASPPPPPEPKAATPLSSPRMKFYDPEDPSTYPTDDLPTLATYPRPATVGYVVDIDPHYPVPPSSVPYV